MNYLAVDQNSRTCIFTELGFGKNYAAGDTLPSFNGIVRINNSETSKAVIRYKKDAASDGVTISPNETLWLKIYGDIEVVSGKVNIMF